MNYSVLVKFIAKIVIGLLTVSVFAFLFYIIFNALVFDFIDIYISYRDSVRLFLCLWIVSSFVKLVLNDKE